MEIDKAFVVSHLKELGKDEHVEKAVQELPEKIDHEKHAQVLEKFGIDPGKLAAEAAEKELGVSAAGAKPPAA